MTTATKEKPAKKEKVTKATKSDKPGAGKKSVKPEHIAEYGAERSHDLPWHNKKVAIFKALKALKATSPTQAVSATEVSTKANVTQRDVRHYCYHAKVSGYIGLTSSEAIRGYGFYLTTKGLAIDPVKAQKEEQKTKTDNK